MSDPCGTTHLPGCDCHGAEGVAQALADACATLAELWRRHDDDLQRARCLRAMEAVIQAKRTMLAADAFVAAATPKARRDALAELRASCHLRVTAPTVAGR
jgi:hypothetical protein